MDKKDEDNKGKKKIWDKVLMGAVIGGAIGSVLGASIAPKKGKETRDELKVGGKILYKKIKNIFTSRKKKIPTEQ